MRHCTTCRIVLEPERLRSTKRVAEFFQCQNQDHLIGPKQGHVKNRGEQNIHDGNVPVSSVFEVF